MRNPIIEAFEKKVFPATVKHPDFRPGDTVRVHYKIEEKPDVNTKFAEKNSVFRRLKVFVSVSKKDTQTLLSLFVRSVQTVSV